MKTITILASVLGIAAVLTFAATSRNTLATDSLVNVAGDSGVALSGYDPVAFFTEGAPVNGDPGISAKHQGATYFFSTKAHQKAFKEDPNQYAPQYGGYCAFGVSVNALFPVDISTWQVREGKLYLNLNPAILKEFNKNIPNHVAKADKNWTALLEKQGG